MKKLVAMLLSAVMVMGLVACAAPAAAPATEVATAAVTEAATTAAATEAATTVAETEAAKEKIELDYYCSIGAYLATLQEEIDKWNASVGKEKGIYINLISNINSYTTDLAALMEAGTHFDITNAPDSTFIMKGWVQDLYAIDNPEIQELLKSYEGLLVNGVNVVDGKCYTIPNTAVPIKLAINTDLFAKNNLEYPKTWDDVVNCAKVITENGGGKEFGFGWSTWSATFRRLCFKLSMSSTGKGWWDTNAAAYDFATFKKPIEAIYTMYQNGWMMGADDLAIDPIRAQFAEGVVGMFPAPSYDYAVYTDQFPAKCNWTVIDGPTIEAGDAPYKGVFITQNGTAIDAVSYAEADDAKKKAMEEAWLFLNSDELNRTIYEMGGIIPAKASVSEGANVSPEIGPQWALFADLNNYAPMSQFPDSLLPLDGDTFATVFQNVMHGGDLDAAIADLNERYNAAYKELKESGDVDTSVYEYTYDIKR